MAVTERVANRVFKRCNGRCEVCGKYPKFPNRITLHHCLFHRSKKHPEYDHEYNLQAVCSICADGTENSYENNEKKHYQNVCSYYGSKKVEDWITSLNLKTREHWD